VVVAGIGHFFPILLFLFLLNQNPLQNPIGSSLLALAGVSMMIGGVGQKVAIISKADYRKEIGFTPFSKKP
jgi:predicted phage tail protein